MARTTISDVFNPEILAETVQGAFAQKDAFMGSILASQGAVVIDPTFDEADPRRIGRTVTVPYFNTLGEFVSNPDGSAVDFSAIGNTFEEATVARDSLAFEVSHWAQHGGTPDRDAYEEAAAQIVVSGRRAMDRAIIAAAATTPLVLDVASSSSPVTMNYDLMVDGSLNFWGDEGQSDVVAAIVHSRTKSDLLKLKDAEGRPLLVPSQTAGDFDRFCGIPLVMSDKAPLTGSTMSAVTPTGTTPPTVTLSGTPNGAHELTIDIVTGGTDGTATFRFKVKGNLWSKTYTVPSGGGAFVLDDSGKVNLLDSSGAKPVDSLVGVNGATGITATFASGTYNADNSYTARASLKVATQLVKRGALAFWYNRAALALDTDKDIARHTKLAAMHLYRTAHLYRRLPGGTLPGVVSIVHNVSGF